MRRRQNKCRHVGRRMYVERTRVFLLIQKTFMLFAYFRSASDEASRVRRLRNREREKKKERECMFNLRTSPGICRNSEVENVCSIDVLVGRGRAAGTGLDIREFTQLCIHGGRYLRSCTCLFNGDSRINRLREQYSRALWLSRWSLHSEYNVRFFFCCSFLLVRSVSSYRTLHRVFLCHYSSATRLLAPSSYSFTFSLFFSLLIRLSHFFLSVLLSLP